MTEKIFLIRATELQLETYLYQNDRIELTKEAEDKIIDNVVEHFSTIGMEGQQFGVKDVCDRVLTELKKLESLK